MSELLKDSGVFVYLLSVIVIINYTSFTKIQRISIIYICTYGLTFTHAFPAGMDVMLLLAVIFIYEEYLTDDSMRIRILYRWSYKFLDALYMAVFQYKILWVIVGILLRADALKEMLCRYMGEEFYQYAHAPMEVLSALCVFVGGIHGMYTVKEVYHSFDEMYGKVQQYPYYSIRFSEPLKERLALVADVEDTTYFQRKNGYSFFSLEFIRIWRKQKNGRERHAGRHPSLQRILSMIRQQVHAVGWKEAVCKGFALVRMQIEGRLYLLKEKWIWFLGLFSRGHSTIEMQLIRILGYKEGLIFGRPKNPEQWFRVLKRKGYECLYSKIFFDGLKWYLSKGLCKDLKDYRYFLVVLYLHTVQSKVGSETYRPLDKMYSDIEIEKWPKELLFLTCLGLNSRPITMTRVWEYWGVIQKYALDEEKLETMVEQL